MNPPSISPHSLLPSPPLPHVRCNSWSAVALGSTIAVFLFSGLACEPQSFETPDGSVDVNDAGFLDSGCGTDWDAGCPSIDAGTVDAGPVEDAGCCASTNTTKGLWGKVSPITTHPNLYYDQGEIDELRQMLLVAKSPQSLVTLYDTQMKGVFADQSLPQTCTASGQCTKTCGVFGYECKLRFNSYMHAAISYMVEPSQTKASHLKARLMEFKAWKPQGLEGGNDYGFSGVYLPWFFDLLSAYHPAIFSAAERADFIDWFKKSAKINMWLSTDRISGKGPFVTRKQEVSEYEGKSIGAFLNLFIDRMTASLNFALVSGDQSLVDFWADSGWPHDKFTHGDVTATWPALDSNLFDLVMIMRAFFPSGASRDTYHRMLWDPVTRTIKNDDGPGGQDPNYHYLTAWHIGYAAEAAYHNGMKDIFSVRDEYNKYTTPTHVFPSGIPYPANTPSLLRNHLFSAGLSTGVIHRGARTGEPLVTLYTGEFVDGHPDVYFGWRRYDHPVVNAAKARADQRNYTSGFSAPHFFGYSKHFFAYPRRAVFRAD